MRACDGVGEGVDSGVQPVVPLLLVLRTVPHVQRQAGLAELVPREAARVAALGGEHRDHFRVRLAGCSLDTVGARDTGGGVVRLRQIAC